MTTRTTSGTRVEMNNVERILSLGTIVPMFLTAIAFVLWALSLSNIPIEKMNDLGYVSILPVTFYAAFVILFLSFVLVLHQEELRETIALIDTILLIMMIHATPNILYGTLRYSWAWKHVGIVDYIQRHGSVDPNTTFLSAYHAWPGFFTMSALFTQVAGFASALSFAGWSPAFFNVLDLGAILMIYRALTHDRNQPGDPRLIWLGAWFFYLTNWIGQDYFSPQAVSYFLYLVVIGVMLKWFRVTTPPSIESVKQWLRVDWVATLFHRLLTRGMPRDSRERAAESFERIGLMLIIILIFFVLASTHQLTPFMMISGLVALVVFQVCRPYTLPILMAGFTVTWIIYVAVSFLGGNLYWIIESIGRLFSNVDSTLINTSKVSAGQALVAIVDRVFTASVLGLAAIGGIRRLRNGSWDLAAMLLVVAPFGMLATNNYGGEMLFRVYFFALPYLAFFAAALIYPKLNSGSSFLTPILIVLLSGALFAGFLFGYYGKERAYHFTRNEVDASQFLYNTAPKGSLLLDATWNYPWAFRNYEYFSYESLAVMKEPALAELAADPVPVVARIMRPYSSAYLVLMRSMKVDIEMSGLMPVGMFDNVQKRLEQSPEFKVVYSNPDAVVFILANRAGTGK